MKNTPEELTVLSVSADYLRLQRINTRLKISGSQYWLFENNGKIHVRYLSLIACPKCGMAETLAEVKTIDEALQFLRVKESVRGFKDALLSA
jgi:hypothetical protein